MKTISTRPPVNSPVTSNVEGVGDTPLSMSLIKDSWNNFASRYLSSCAFALASNLQALGPEECLLQRSLLGSYGPKSSPSHRVISLSMTKRPSAWIHILQKVTKNLDRYGIEMSSGRSKIMSHSDRAWTVALLVKELKIVKAVRELWVIVQKGCFGLAY